MNDFTLNELKVLRVTLIMEWEVKSGVRWRVDDVDILSLVNKLEAMIDEKEGVATSTRL